MKFNFEIWKKENLNLYAYFIFTIIIYSCLYLLLAIIKNNLCYNYTYIKIKTILIF